ncbi:MAG: zinc ribbon domain-containing protein [Acidobacteriales bacterium]|nr:zinc ribbon domain-containing protein [Terriglobales bacterium]
MAVELEKRTRLDNMWHMIPGWAIALAVLAFIGLQVLMQTVVAHSPGAPPLIARIPIGLLGGAVLSCYLLLVGYINVDSKARGMNRALWTLIAAFVPNGFGIMLYFILRQPLGGCCPRCGASVQAGYFYCPKCSAALHITCPNCHREVHPGDPFCPYCGKSVAPA